MTTFNRKVFAQLWANPNIPTKRIADAMGITRQGVSWHAKHMGLPSRAKLRLRKHDPALLAEMWLAGVSSAQIAAHFGMAHHSSAINAARKAGLPHRKRGPSGKKNGGWVENLPIEAFFLARTARAEQNQLLLAEMVDSPRGSLRRAA